MLGCDTNRCVIISTTTRGSITCGYIELYNLSLIDGFEHSSSLLLRLTQEGWFKSYMGLHHNALRYQHEADWTQG
jgi:hypothetical protein